MARTDKAALRGRFVNTKGFFQWLAEILLLGPQGLS